MSVKTKTLWAGFSLIEILIVIVIISILAMVAFPSYQDSVRKARRADGQAFLLELAQAQERHFTQFSRYASTVTTGATTLANIQVGSVTSDEGFYAIQNVTSANPFTTYSITVRPDPADPDCGDLSLNQAGVKGATLGTTDLCW